MKVKNILKSRAGTSTPLTIALILCLLLISCAIAEFARLGIIISGVRDGLQQAVISVAITNYDETYPALREGYSGGYFYTGSHWEENLDYDDVYYRLDALLGTDKSGSYLIKKSENGYEYRLSGLKVDISNVSLTPGGTDQNLEVDARITIEVPLSFGWESLPPLRMELRTRAAYMPKF